jgi:hypothetical protein
VISDPKPPLSAELVVLVSAEGPESFAVRLREAARSATLEGKLLAAWCLSGPVRDDLPAALLGEGHLAGLGLAPEGLAAARDFAALAALRARLERGGLRAEQLDGPFLWYF